MVGGNQLRMRLWSGAVWLLVIGCALFFANSRTYSYDACGNMTNRNGMALLYDEENQLKQYGSITFGYADGGARLWKSNGSMLTVWIGGIYEIRGSQTLCHVYAGGQRKFAGSCLSNYRLRR